MSFPGSGSGEGMSVGTLTATYKIIQDRQNTNTIGQIVQEGNQIRNVFGNVQMKLDTSQYLPAVGQMIAANTNYKNSAAQAQQALAQLRQEQLLGAQAVTAQKNAMAAAATTFAQTRLTQQQTAQATQAATAAIQANNVATAAQRTQAAAAATATATLRTQIAALQLANLQAAAAVQQHGQAHQSLISWIQQSAIAGAAFRAGEDLLQASIRGVDAAIRDSIGAFINWQQTLQRIGANSQLTNEDIKTMDASIRSMAASAPTDMAKLAQGFRLASDEGFNIAESQKLANVAMMAAVATGSNETDVMNVLAVAMHIYHIELGQTQQTMDLLIQSAKLGRLTLEEFVTGTQRGQSVAANYGLTLQDTTAALSAFTRNGYTAQQASTQLVGALTHIADPTAAARKEIALLSQQTGVDLVSDFTHAGLATKGLSGIMADLQQVIEITGDQSIISKLIPALRGAQGGYVLLGNGAKDYKDIQASLNAVITGQSTPTVDAFTNASKTAAFQIGVFKNELRLFGLEIGQRLVPYLQMAVSWMQKLLQSLGVDFKIPGMETLKTETEGVGGAASNAALAIGKLNFAAQEDKSRQIMDATSNLDRLGGEADGAAAKIRELTTVANGLKTAMDGINETMRNVKDDFASLIDPLEAQLKAVKQITPEEFNRHIADLQLQAQEIQLKLAAPDTTQYTMAIDALKQKILDLGEPDTAAVDAAIDGLREKLDSLAVADTGAVDARLEMLRDKMQALGKIATVELDKQITGLRTQLDSLGDTKAIDRQIEDIQQKMKQPEQSTAVQEAGMASLTSQLAGGTINYAAFDAAYGALGRQKQAIVENNTVRKTALQQELADLETKRTLQKRIDDDAKAAIDAKIKSLELEKAGIMENNTIEKNRVQDQIDAAEKEKKGIEAKHAADRKGIEDEIKADEKRRKGIIDTFNEEKKGYENRVKQLEIDKSLATAEYDQKMKTITEQLAHNALLDNQARITREIASYPLETQIAKYKDQLAEALLPLQKQKDLQQTLIDKNNEALGIERAKKAELDAQLATAKELLKTLETGTTDTSPEGGKGPGGAVPPPGTSLGAPSGPGSQPGWGGAGSAWAPPAWIGALADAFNGLKDAIAAAQPTFTTFSDWLEEHAIPGARDFAKVLTNEVVPGLGYFLTGLTGLPLEDVNKRLSENDFTLFMLGTDLRDKISPMVTNAFNSMKLTVSGFFDGVKSVFAIWRDVFNNDWDKLLNTDVPNLFKAGGRLLTGALGETLGSLITLVTGEGGLPKIEKLFRDTFAEGGHLGSLLSGFGTIMHDITVGFLTFAFGPGGYWGKAFDDMGTTTNDWFGKDQKIGTLFSNFGTFISNFFSETGPINKAIQGYRGFMKAAINTAFVDPLNGATSRFADFVNLIGGGIKDLGGKVGITIDIPHWDAPQITPLAAGTQNWQGGAALVGEAGREIGIINGMARLFDTPQIVNLPPGTIIKPNSETERLIANSGRTGSNFGGTSQGFAAGLAQGSTGNYGLGGVLDVISGGASAVGGTIKGLAGDAAGVARSIVAGGFDAMVDGIMKLGGVPSFPGVMSGMGAGVVTTVANILKDGLKDLWDSLVSNTPKAQNLGAGVYGGGGAALLPLLDLIRQSASDYSVPPEIIGAIILHESGGIIGRREIGGGQGRGLMQVDGGTWPQAYDPRMSGTSLADAAYQIDVGSMILGRAYAAAGGDTEKALTYYSGSGFASQHGGLDFYQELQKMGLISAAQNALSGNALLGPNLPGGNNDVVNQAMRYIGDIDSGGLTSDGGWSGWCERFVEFMNQFAGTGLVSGTFGSAKIHQDNSLVSTDSNPPPGASVFWYGNGWGGSYGHVGVAVGDGTVISTTGYAGDRTPIRHSSGWIGAPGYQGWAPPGMANGTVASTPQIVTIGDIPGRVPEIVAPQPMMKQSVKDAIIELGRANGSGGNVIFEAGSIVQAPGEDAEALAQRIAERVRRKMQSGGMNGI